MSNENVVKQIESADEIDGALAEAFPPEDETFNPILQGSFNGNADLYRRLASAMTAISSVKKSGRNVHFKYDYVTAEDIKREARTALAENGIVIIPEICSVDDSTKIGNQTRFRVHVHYIIACESGYITIPWVSDALDNQDKGIAKAITAGNKNFLIHLLQIPTGDEDDTDTSQPQEEPIIKDETWAKAYTITRGDGNKTTVGELSADELQWIVDNKQEKSDVYQAAYIVLGKMAA